MYKCVVSLYVIRDIDNLSNADCMTCGKHLYGQCLCNLTFKLSDCDGLHVTPTSILSIK